MIDSLLSSLIEKGLSFFQIERIYSKHYLAISNTTNQPVVKW